MKKFVPLLFYLLHFIQLPGQSYTSYFTGNSIDTLTSPNGGICMMGGATEHDEAMKWFLQRADGGDILVLRASGSDGYNDYLYSSLGVAVNSVESIVFHNGNASNEPYIWNKINNAEAIWIAGGDQWDYVSFWRNSPVDSLINLGILNRNIAIGGTSAGMAIQGSIYFTAQNGTVTSPAALSNPYNNKVTIDSASFIKNSFLHSVITDTHYDNPDRKGRHVTFIARALTDYNINARGIACDEYTAVCVDTSGLARVYGDYPAYDDNAYFIQTNCELPDITPENCSPGSPLNWNLGGHSIKAYKVKGAKYGNNSFDLKDWQTGAGGVWENWSVGNGTLVEAPGDPIDCTAVSTGEPARYEAAIVFPNPTADFIRVETGSAMEACEILDSMGCKVREYRPGTDFAEIDLTGLKPGLYFLKLVLGEKIRTEKIIKH